MKHALLTLAVTCLIAAAWANSAGHGWWAALFGVWAIPPTFFLYVDFKVTHVSAMTVS